MEPHVRRVSNEDNTSGIRLSMTYGEDGPRELVVETGPPIGLGGEWDKPAARLGTFGPDVSAEEVHTSTGLNVERLRGALRGVRG